MSDNIAAYTVPEADYPSYVSINVTDDGRVSIAVRGGRHVNNAGHAMPGSLSQIVLSKDQFRGLVHEINVNGPKY